MVQADHCLDFLADLKLIFWQKHWNINCFLTASDWKSKRIFMNLFSQMQINGITANEIQTWTGLCKSSYTIWYCICSQRRQYRKQECNQLALRNFYYHKPSLFADASYAKLFCTTFSITRFLVYTIPQKILSALADRNCKFIATRFFFDVSSKKEPWSSSADPPFDCFALCCIKRIVRYYPCGELTLTIFFSWTRECYIHEDCLQKLPNSQ